ncbi:MAG: leucyl aminopeptidase [Pseudomonadota bacterium]
MKNILMMKGARTLLDNCARVKAGESVLIITDMNMKPSIAEVLAAAAAERGAEPIIMIIRPRLTHGQEPPANVAEAMKKAEVIFTPVSTSITHTRAIKEAAEAGARALVMTAFTEELLISGPIEADFLKQMPICKAVAEVFQKGKKAHLTTPMGTDLKLNLEGRRGNALTSIVGPGQFSTTPTIEANFSPVEGSAEGTIVADASIPYLNIGVLEEPVRVKVDKGFIVDIQGGHQARIIGDNLASQKDPNCYNIAELGVGLNPAAKICGVMLDDEGAFGVVHIGIGTNITLGGVIKAKTHYDLLMYKSTLVIDGKEVLKDGNLVI